MVRTKPANFVGVKGKSGRKSYRDERDFFAKLDKSLPTIVDYCLKLIAQANEIDSKERHELGLKAAQILMSKAPQRIAGTGDAGEIVVKQVIYAQGNNSTV